MSKFEIELSFELACEQLGKMMICPPGTRAPGAHCEFYGTGCKNCWRDHFIAKAKRKAVKT